ncbi:MAG: flavodoxin family protein [Spirochaetes bacterium]|nr:flavodoxin family protein [Spirochaetota bacterium]
MKHEIYYFSGTGNSLYAAEKIAFNLNAELIPVASIADSEKIIITADSAGFVFPLYYQGLPVVMMEFFDKIEFTNESYVFAVVTRGLAPTGGVLNKMNSILKNRNMKLDYGAYVTMPSNFFLPVDKGVEKNYDKFNLKIDRKISAICSDLRKGNKRIEFEPVFFYMISGIKYIFQIWIQPGPCLMPMINVRAAEHVPASVSEKISA